MILAGFGIGGGRRTSEIGRRCADDMPGAVGLGRSLLADAAYDSNQLRDRIAAIGATAVIRPISRRLSPPEPDREAYRRRDRIERFFSKLKQYRAIAARYEKRDANFLAIVKLAATRIRSRVYEPVA